MPGELVVRAQELGLSALGLTDHDGFPGVVQFAGAAREAGLPAVIGTELSLPVEGAHAGTRTGQKDPDSTHLLVLARGPEGYRRLSRAIGRAQLASGAKGVAHYSLESLAEQAAGTWQILTGCRKGHVRRALEVGVDEARWELERLVSLFGRDNVAVELTDHGYPHDRSRNECLASLAAATRTPVVATGQVHYARAEDRPLGDVLAAIRARSTLDEIDPWLPTVGMHLRSEREMLAIHHRHPQAVSHAGRLGEELAFDLDLVIPRLPQFPVPPGYTEDTWLAELTRRAASERYGPRGSERISGAWDQIDRELEIIADLGFSGYFLIVHDIVEFCRESDIYCQGRGSAANSAVCFALGITAVDAVRHAMLFERFLSPDRSGPPDIDIDIEAGRREEVIQYVYDRYDREHAAQVANVISYRPRSAIRDCGRAFGYEEGQVDYWAKSVERWGNLAVADDGEGGSDTREADDLSEIPERVRAMGERMLRLPRHLGIHSGGMVMCDRPVIDVCPVGWAAAPGRTVLQWDKDDCAEAGLVKFDLLGLGMLTALRIAFEMIAGYGATNDGERYTLHTLPPEDPRVYDLLCEADTVGVFQVESRAQMSTLPRLRPRTFYDIVIEVALIRPGPIQGQAVNPYIARRRGREPVTYLDPRLKPALEKTLGVPLFQEQLMHIAVDAAGFTPAMADQLRKAMGAKRSAEKMRALKGKLVRGMAENGIDSPTAEKIYDSLQAFADFGFPESHAFSFAYLVYASAWLKVHHPEAFYAGILGAQPMGFYSPQSLVADARRHGVRIARADVNHSEVDASIERSDRPVVGENARRDRPGPLVDPHPDLILRLGLSQVSSIGKAAEVIVTERANGPYSSLVDLARRCQLNEKTIRILSEAGALESLIPRRQGMWAAETVAHRSVAGPGWIQPTIPGTEIGVTPPPLAEMNEEERLVADVLRTGVSPDAHPMSLVRPRLVASGIRSIREMVDVPPGTRVTVAGVVTHRQRPHTARGTLFLSIEDETGMLNIVCSAGLWQAQKKTARSARALLVRGMVEQADGAVNFVADRFSPLHLAVPSRSRDFR